MESALFIVRIVVGGLFLLHGAQKLFGRLQDEGIAGTASALEQAGVRPGRLYAPLTGIIELGAGALTALGFLGPVGPIVLIGVMVSAIGLIHLRRGLWNAHGGFEYNLLLIANCLALVLAGPGRISVDAAARISLLPEPATTIITSIVALASTILSLTVGSLMSTDLGTRSS